MDSCTEGTEEWYLEKYVEWLKKLESPNILYVDNFMYLIETNNATSEKTLALVNYFGTEDATVRIPATVTDPATNEEYPVKEP